MNETSRPDSNDPERTDAAFEAIVSSLRDQPAVAEPTWPDAEDVESSTSKEERDDDGAPEATSPSRLGSDWTGWEDLAPAASEPELSDDEEDVEHYEPPPPPPLPRGDRVLRWGWAGALGAPGFLAISFVFGWNLSDLTTLALVAAFLAGFVTLVARMRPGRSEDDTDDGAVV